MDGKIIRIEKVERNSKENKKTIHFITTCDIVDDNGEVRRLKWDVTEKYFKSYAKFCGYTSTKEMIGAKVSVIIARREYEDKEGVLKRYTFIKYLNFVDDATGELFIMNKGELNENF